MLLFTTSLSNRLQYIAQIIFGNSVSITNNIEYANSYKGLIVNYSNNHHFTNELHIQPINLLFEEDIKAIEVSCFKWKNEIAFFKTSQGIGFDILSASFYLISRYEEYVATNFDEHYSFSYKDSVAYKQNFLKTPLVNIWWDILKQDYPLLALPPSTFNFTSTFDIDIAYKFKHHSKLKNFVGGLKELVTLNIGRLIERWQFAKSNALLKDPYDVFDWLEKLHIENEINVIYFCLTQLQRTKYDVNVHAKSKGLKTLLQVLSKKNEMGIHPSYKSGTFQLKNKDQILKKEISNLQSIVNKKIVQSRQHYLIMQLPTTYQTLIGNNIIHDYSMGYNYQNGFRASYCKPFYWFDLTKNCQTNLLIHPFCAMDSNFIFNQQYNLSGAIKELQDFYQIIKKYNGEMITIFHNHFVQTNATKLNWTKLYDYFLLFVHTNNKIKN